LVRHTITNYIVVSEASLSPSRISLLRYLLSYLSPLKSLLSYLFSLSPQILFYISSLYPISCLSHCLISLIALSSLISLLSYQLYLSSLIYRLYMSLFSYLSLLSLISLLLSLSPLSYISSLVSLLYLFSCLSLISLLFLFAPKLLPESLSVKADGPTDRQMGRHSWTDGRNVNLLNRKEKNRFLDNDPLLF
jgi:hypothetical protein